MDAEPVGGVTSEVFDIFGKLLDLGLELSPALGVFLKRWSLSHSLSYPQVLRRELADRLLGPSYGRLGGICVCNGVLMLAWTPRTINVNQLIGWVVWHRQVVWIFHHVWACLLLQSKHLVVVLTEIV